MANVPLSERLCASIIEKATAPFNTIIGDTLDAIANDPQLGRLVRECATTKEQADLAERLHGMNSEWQKVYNAHVKIKHPNEHVYELNSMDQPFPVQAWNSIEIVAGDHPPILARLDELLIPKVRAEADRDAIKTTLNGIFESVPSLQRAVAVLPSILDWIDDDVRTRYNAPNPQRTKNTTTAEELRSSLLSNEAVVAIARGKMQ